MSETAELKRSPILDPQRMLLAEFEMQVFTANCEIDITVKDLSDPAYWSHVAKQLKPYDQIWARAEDGSWMAHLSVASCSLNWAKVHVLKHYELAAIDVEADQNVHTVEWKGPQRKFAIIRKSDKELIKDGFADKASAMAAMVEHERLTG